MIPGEVENGPIVSNIMLITKITYWNTINDFPTRWKQPSMLALLNRYAEGPQRKRAQDFSTKLERLSGPVTLDVSMPVSLRSTSDAGMTSRFVDWRVGIVASDSAKGGR